MFERTGADQVGAYLTTLPGKATAVGRAIAAATSSRFGAGSGARVPGSKQGSSHASFGGFHRDVFDRFGPYDERLVRNQDISKATSKH